MIITPTDIQNEANSVSNIYSYLEDKIFTLIIHSLQKSRYDSVDQSNVLLWQAEQLNKMGVLNDQVIELLAKLSHKTATDIKKLIVDNGHTIVDEIDRELERMVKKSVPVSKEIDEILDSFVHQTFKDLNNNVNQTLVTTNFNENAVMRVYQAILKQSTIEVMSGLKTHEKAIKDNVYKMADVGIKSSFTDRAGNEWSMEAYSRMVIQTTSHRTFNDLRLKRMDDFDCVTALMSSHAAARKACAGIQGKVVNTVPMDDERADSRYDSIYNHGYGSPQGTQGIGCTHMLYPHVPGANTNNQPQYDLEEAIKNADIQQQQRKIERDIRYQKKRLSAANELEDIETVRRAKEVINNKQKQIRELVNKHDFLVRDYSREQVYSK